MFDFYRHLSRSLKQGRKKLGIICVLCAKVLDGTNYDQCTWVKCGRFITNNTTNLLYHLDIKHSCIFSVKSLVSNNKQKELAEILPSTVNSIVSSPNTRVTSSISVTMDKFSMELVQRDVFCWIYTTIWGRHFHQHCFV